MTRQFETQIPCTSAAAQAVAIELVLKLEEQVGNSISIRDTIDAAEFRSIVDDSIERPLLEIDPDLESRS